MIKPEVIVVDYGVGNLFSVRRALESCGANVVVTSDPERVAQAIKLVLPGVGAFDDAMKALNRLGLTTAIKHAAEHAPLLGICLGMQLLLEESHEFGLSKGLSILPGYVEAIPSRTNKGEIQKIPHIGWSSLIPTDRSWTGTLLDVVQLGSSVYFAHSFVAVPTDSNHRLADCLYGGHKLTAVLHSGNIMACQFHPEKSGEVGLKILRRFITA